MTKTFVVIQRNKFRLNIWECIRMSHYRKQMLKYEPHRRLGVLPYLLIIHCVKNVRIRSYSGPYFPAFELNTETYF